MKKRTGRTRTFAIMLVISLVLTFAVQETNADDSGLVDSGIDYTDGCEKEVTEDPNTGKPVYVDALHMNPYRGIHVWGSDLVLENSDDNTAVEPYLPAIMKERSLGYLVVDISDFSGAYHLTDGGDRGPDAELPESALAAIDQTLKNFKKNNMQVIIRFVYDQNNNGIKAGEGWINENGKSVVEARQDMILKHISQIAEVLNANADTILTVQIGFYGHYGELHGSPMCSKNNFKGALKTMLEATRKSGLRVSMRTPSKLAYYLDYDISNSSELDEFVQTVTAEGEDAYRAAIFNDGYLGSDSDLGTYYNREKETDWMATQNLHNPYGGDLVPDPNTGTAAVEAQQPKVIKEMAKVRTSYFAPDYRVQAYWEGETYDGSLYDGDAYAKNDPEYEGQSLWTYIENHIGYRFVIRESKLSKTVKTGGAVESAFTVENVGFGNLLYPVESYAYITDKAGDVVVGPTEVDVDPTDFHIKSSLYNSISIDIPDDVEPGEYDLYIQFKIGDREVDGKTKPYGAIRFANKGIWNPVLEANRLGSFTVERAISVTKNWADESQPKYRPDSLTFTIEKAPRLPEEYQEVEYIQADGTQWIDTGVVSDASYTIYSEGCAYPEKTSGLLQSFNNSDNRLGFKLYGKSKKVGYYWRIAGAGQGNKEISTDDLGGIDVTKKLQVTQSATDIVIRQEGLTKASSSLGATSGGTGGNWMIFKSNETDSCGILYEAKIIEGEEVIHHYIPCYKKADSEIGVYDLIDGTFLSNAGSGVFEKGEDVVFEPKKVTIAKDQWTVNGDAWKTTVPVGMLSGDLTIFEDEIKCYESDATSASKKTISSNNAVEITNTMLEHDWDDGVVTKEPTTEEEGIKTFTCKKCGGEKTESIPKLDPPPEEEEEDPPVDPGEEDEEDDQSANPDKEDEENNDPENTPQDSVPSNSILYRNIEGNGLTWNKGSGEEGRFVFKRSIDDEKTFSEFNGILVDGKSVPRTNYKATEGSVIIDLNADYMETLSIGEHTLTAIFIDGNDVTVKFTITRDQSKTIPPTGDENKVLPYALAIMMSLMAVYALRQAKGKARP